jgi:hypothetical protein
LQLSPKDIQELADKNPDLLNRYPELSEFINQDLPQKMPIKQRQKVVRDFADKSLEECLLELGYTQLEISKMSLPKARMIVYGELFKW